jgi:hypothetical protein
MVSPRVAFHAIDAAGITAEVSSCTKHALMVQMWAKQNGHAACADLLAMARWDMRLARGRGRAETPPARLTPLV